MNLILLGMQEALAAPADPEIRAIGHRLPTAEALPDLAPAFAELVGVLDLDLHVATELAGVAEALPVPEAPTSLQDRVRAARTALRRGRARADVATVTTHRASLRALVAELEKP